MTTTDQPNWPDGDPRWLRATYDELVKLQAMLERAVAYKPVPMPPEDQRTDRNARKGSKPTKQAGDFGETTTNMLLGACFVLAVVALMIPFVR